MRKFRYLLGTCIVGIVALTTSAFAYFNFSSNSSTDTNANANNKDYVNNIEFDENSTEDSDRTYTLYFFASPYYATGYETETISSETDAIEDLTDPLTIAESDDNPYIDSTEYCITSYTALTDDEVNYANYTDSSGNYRYISTPDYDVSIGTKLSTVTNKYTKTDFFGTVEADNEAHDVGEFVYKTDSNGNEQALYFKVEVEDSIKSDVLRNIYASTVFKNRYGFSPEFMGWTYDKQACFERVTCSAWDNSYHRYYNNDYLGNYYDLKMNSVTTDSDGNVTINSDNPDQIGNFGANSYIDIFSSDDSLYGIDNNARDGSGSNDKVIYLYPVFGDRTISTSTSVKKAPILKMLSNPDTDETSNTYYKYHQEGENDYSIGSDYTTERKATFLTYNKDIDLTLSSGVTEPNYTLKNFYVDQEKDENDEFKNYYLLEVLTVDNDAYSSSWGELFDNKNLIDLFNISDTTKKEYFENFVNSYYGTFDIDIILSQSDFTFSAFKNPELYINNPTKKSATINGITVYYVIGLKRNNSLKFITSNNNVLNYGSRRNVNYFTKTSLIWDQSEDSSYWHYYTCQPFEVTDTTNFYSVMFKESYGYCVDSTNKYTKKFGRITTNVLKAFNNYLDESNFTNKVNYVTANEKQNVTASTATQTISDGESQKTATNFPTITIKKKGTYEILAAVKYSDGFPSDIQIGFREYTEVCNLLVLSQDPISAKSTSQNYKYSDITSTYKDSILLEGEFTIGDTITKDTKIGKTKFSEILSSSTYKDKELYDLATDQPVKTLIENKEFVLSRNMILYYKS